MFVDQLLLTISIKYNGVVIKPFHLTSQLKAVHEKYGDGSVVLADLVKKYILQVYIVFHLLISPLSRLYIVIPMRQRSFQPPD